MKSHLKRLFESLIILALMKVHLAAAVTVSEDFSTLSRKDSGTLVWNIERGTLHPPLMIYRYQDSGPFVDRTFEVGTGRHGAFVASDYAKFSQGGVTTGQMISLNTDDYPLLEVTHFRLEQGWTLRPVGSKPLIIRSQGDVIILGTIDCSGEDGEDQNGNPAATTAGGIGHCGGGAGGAGASWTSTLAESNGLAGGITIPNGSSPGVDGPTGGGGASAPASGGGGGGSYGMARGPGYDATAGVGVGAGAPGLFGRDNAFIYSGGGWGGGGGGYYNSGGAGQNTAGGGGGAGGGYVFITSAGAISIGAIIGGVTISAGILATGGGGGSSNGVTLGGGGGGGGGGSIALFAQDEVFLDGAPVVSAQRGNGGSSVLSAADGGPGSAGRTWLVGKSGYSYLVPPLLTSEYPDPLLADVGTTRYQSGTFTAETLALDTWSSHPSLSAVNATTVVPLPGPGSLTIAVASSSEAGFTPTTWSTTTSLPMELERYLRFQITVVNATPATPVEVDSLNVTLSPNQQDGFQFGGACGSLDQGSAMKWLWFALPLLTLMALRRRSPRYS